jgi:hypothetical protein
MHLHVTIANRINRRPISILAAATLAGRPIKCLCAWAGSPQRQMAPIVSRTESASLAGSYE